MSNAGNTHSLAEGHSRLSTALRDVKNAAADREDVVVEMRETQYTRLEILAQELEPVFAEVPADDPSFDFAISSGAQPRLWIDAVAHVTMGRDRRTYRFLRDSRLGRTVLAESADIKPVADQVTRYIAERLVERQRALAGDIASMGSPAGPDEMVHRGGPHNPWPAFLVGLSLVIAGGAVGVVTMLFYLALRFPELGIGF